jgi:hypothetical protein
VKTLQPEGEAGEVWLTFHKAAFPTLNSIDVWAEERARIDAAPLPWPLADGDGHVGLVRYLIAQSVALVLHLLEQRLGPERVPPEDPTDAEFQCVLRVVQRASAVGEAALVKHYGGSGRLSVRRDFDNWRKECLVAQALSTGTSLPRLAAAAGMSLAAAKRAKKRLLE